jgi:hypothetical protein
MIKAGSAQDVLDAIRLLERKLWYTGRTGRKK